MPIDGAQGYIRHKLVLWNQGKFWSIANAFLWSPLCTALTIGGTYETDAYLLTLF